jgi:hypothetical protein
MDGMAVGKNSKLLMKQIQIYIKSVQLSKTLKWFIIIKVREKMSREER